MISLNAVLDALHAEGLEPMDPSALRLDGVLQRFDCTGDRRGKRNAWCVVFGDGPRPVLVFGHWARGIHATKALGSSAPLSPAEREKQRNAIAHASAAREAQKQRAHMRARHQATQIWLHAKPASPLHPYLTRKGIPATGCRESGGRLLVPLRDQQGNVWNVQKIRADGQKRFLLGGRVQGLYASIGGPVGDHLLICEGWATGQSLHAATGLPVAVAFSAGNLMAIAKTMRAKYRRVRITVAADNDVKPDGTNPGLDAARAAAAAVNGYLAVPPIPCDFNDYAAHGGSAPIEEASPA